MQTMQNIIIFFHGYASSPKAEKFQKLIDRFGPDQVFAFAADLNPQIAQTEVLANIQRVIATKKASVEQSNDKLASGANPIRLILVGSSMGCWLACRLREKLKVDYPCQLVLINPCLDPAVVRVAHPEHAILLVQYEAIKPLPKAHYFISRHDEVIDHTELIEELEGSEEVSIFENSDHRFNGPEFSSVIQYIEKFF
jgi:predicted esterase YcpF (UPF0227 family)